MTRTEQEETAKRAAYFFVGRFRSFLQQYRIDVADVEQEAMLLLLMSREKIELSTGDQQAYLFVTVLGGLKNMLRQHRRRSPLATGLWDDSWTTAESAVVLGPHEHEAAEMRAVVRRGVGPVISDKTVDMLCDYHLKNHSCQEIADRYALTPGSARSLLYRNTEILHTRLFCRRTPGSTTEGRRMVTTQYKVGDRVVILVPENDRVHGTEGVIKEVRQEPNFGEPYYLLAAPASASGEFRVLAEEMTPAPPIKPTKKKPNPKELGYTGDVCSYCQGSRVTRNGACLKCEDCGESSGCS